jgi:hypothetical protein
MSLALGKWLQGPVHRPDGELICGKLQSAAKLARRSGTGKSRGVNMGSKTVEFRYAMAQHSLGQF